MAAVPEGLLLDPAADLVDDIVAELDHVEGVEHPHRLRQGRRQRGRIPTERVQGGQLDAPAPLLLLLLLLLLGENPVAVGLSGAPGHHVEQPRRPPRGQVDDAGGEAGAGRRGPAWAHTCSSTPNPLTPASRAGSSTSGAP